MKKALLLLVMLAMLGGAGYIVYHFFFRTEEVGFQPLDFPKQAKGLNQTGSITAHPHGLYEVSAADMHDLLFLQGVLHGTHAGTELEQLVRLFKGIPAKTGVKALDDLAPVFYYLDLTTAAEACVQQVPHHVSVLLTAYAEGLSEAGGGRRWTLTDLFVYQRGLAFLINRCWAKEWAMRWWVRELGAEPQWFGPGLPPVHPPADPALESDLAPAGLFRAPWIEMVLFRDANGATAQHLRGDPFFQFLAVPTRFEIPELYVSEGLSLAGLPFLWSGQTAGVQFALQPRLTRDETFYVFPEDQFVGQEALFRESDTGNIAKLYDQAPIRAPFGRWVKPLVFGAGVDTYYDWDGFRPSADLVALYYLFTAGNLDDARAAMQYHQVPSAALLLGGESPRRNARLYASSNPSSDRGGPTFQPPLFRRPWEEALPAAAVTGSDFVWAAWADGGDFVKNNRFREDSPLDAALVDALLFRLDGALQTELSDKQLEAVLELLNRSSDAERAMFIAEVWRQLTRRIAEVTVEDQAAWWVPVVNMPLRRLILAELRARQSRIRGEDGDLGAFNQMTARSLKAALARTRDENALLVLGADGLAMGMVGDVRESGSPTAIFTAEQGRVAQVGWLTMVWHEPLLFWHYPIRDGDGQLGAPKRVTYSPASATPASIRPRR
ncbi:hypothetical protein [Acanthopleuribacter pedis]|uniref:Penicillin amidase n=1 Tax=Acanthopleuribacter pedis TaxID=442870 RepID=A0A8J7U698_9BACT|nr:hypothetical protein [Acanthopleuribacter pedis]MBO1321238.1 hypothetical protein [Acanthopleuribacter pedis]